MKKTIHKFLIPDTNIYLHFKLFDEIDWTKLSAAKKTTLLVPNVVISELNKQKDQNPREHLRERAAKVIKLLWRFSESEDEEMQVRKNVFLRFLPWDKQFDFHKFGLSPDCADDKLLAASLQNKAESGDTETIIVTDDINLRLKAKSLEIAVLCLPEELEMPAKLDAEQKRIQQLERKIRELQLSTPQLTVTFQNGQSVCNCKIAKPHRVPSPSLFKDLQKVKLEYPLWEIPIPHEPRLIGNGKTAPQEEAAKVQLEELKSQLTQIHPTTIACYNRELQSFYERYARYHNDYFSYQNELNRIVDCKIFLVSNGTVPAQDIDLFFQAESGIEFLLENHLPQAPTAPTPPEPPQEMGTIIGANVAAFFQRIFKKQNQSNLLLPTVAGSDLQGNAAANLTVSQNKQQLLCKFKYLKHNMCQQIRFFARFDSDESATSCRIKYAALVANIQQRVDGELHFAVEK